MCTGLAGQATKSETVKKAVPKNSIAGAFLRRDDKKNEKKDRENQEQAKRDALRSGIGATGIGQPSSLN